MAGRISPQLEQEIIAMYVDAKMGSTQISQQTGLAISTVMAALRRNGVLIRQPGVDAQEGRRRDYDAMIDDYKAMCVDGGAPTAEFCIKWGISQPRLYQIFSLLGVSINEMKQEANNDRQERYDLAVAAYEKGTPTQEIIATLGISAPTLYLLLRKRGVSLRGRQRTLTPAQEAERLARLEQLVARVSSEPKISGEE